jgi:hypothetical protein
MENLHDTSIFEFNISESTKEELGGIALWAKISALLGFASMVVSVVSTIKTIITFSEITGSTAQVFSPALGTLVTVIISLILNITLLSAANQLKNAVDQINQDAFGKGISKLSAYLKITGILFIIVLVIAVLAIIVAIVLGARYGTNG